MVNDFESFAKETLRITGTSPDGKYVNLNVRTAAQVDLVFQWAQEVGLLVNEVVNPTYEDCVWPEGHTQFIHIWTLDIGDKFFFTRAAIEKILSQK